MSRQRNMLFHFIIIVYNAKMRYYLLKDTDWKRSCSFGNSSNNARRSDHRSSLHQKDAIDYPVGAWIKTNLKLFKSNQLRSDRLALLRELPNEQERFQSDFMSTQDGNWLHIYAIVKGFDRRLKFGDIINIYWSCWHMMKYST